MSEKSQYDHQSGRFDVDVNLNITSWDDGMVCFTGLSAESVRGKSLAAMFPDLGTRGFLDRFQRVLNDGTVEVFSPAFHRYLIPCRPVKPSKRFARMRQRARILPLHAGASVVGAAVTIEDVTPRLERERDLAEQLVSTDENVRLQAARALAHGESLDELPPLLDVIGDSNWQVRGVAVEGIKRQATPQAIDELIRLIRLDHRNISLLNSALKVLAETKEETLPSLMECLRDDDPGLRMQILLVLGLQGNPQAIPALLAALNDPDENVRFHAIEALGKLRAREAVKPLIELAEVGEFFIGFAALVALGQIGDASVVSRVITLLSNEALASAAVETLGLLGHESAIGPLVEVLNGANPPVSAVVAALSSIYDRLQESGEGIRITDFFKLAISPVGIANLKKTLRGLRGADLKRVVMVLGWTDDPTVPEALADLIGEPEATDQVVDALVRRGHEVTKLLVRHLESTELDVQQAVISALGKIRDSSAIPPLVKVLLENEELRIAAADALAKIGDPGAAEPLLRTLNDQKAAVRLASVGAINRIAPPEMAERVIGLLNDPDARVREAGARIAGYYGYAVDALVERCRDVDERVRRAVVETLPFVDHDRSGVLLVNALQTDVPFVRGAAAAALAHCSADFALAHLINALRDKDGWVRYFAARSLGRHRSEAAVEALENVAFNDSAVYARVAAVEALGAIGTEQALQTVSKLVNSANPDIAKVAAAYAKDSLALASPENAPAAPLTTVREP